mmetsp:Transcript_85170/g.244475  ORF Transcript_85170/g.244475 Transcript_85170/m.244475 type:complete len:205 (+) Transcript_85170:1165-1779(+)
MATQWTTTRLQVKRAKPSGASAWRPSRSASLRPRPSGRSWRGTQGRPRRRPRTAGSAPRAMRPRSPSSSSAPGPSARRLRASRPWRGAPRRASGSGGRPPRRPAGIGPWPRMPRTRVSRGWKERRRGSARSSTSSCSRAPPVPMTCCRHCRSRPSTPCSSPPRSNAGCCVLDWRHWRLRRRGGTRSCRRCSRMATQPTRKHSRA